MTQPTLIFFLVVLGASFLGNAVAGLKRGRIRAGSKGFRAYIPTRSEQPLEFWMAVTFFLVIGAGALVAALLTAIGVPVFALRA